MTYTAYKTNSNEPHRQYTGRQRGCPYDRKQS